MSNENVSEYTAKISRIGELSRDMTEKINAGASLAAVKPQQNEAERLLAALVGAKHPAVKRYGRAMRAYFKEAIKLQQKREAGESARNLRRQIEKMTEKQAAVETAAADVERLEAEGDG